MRFCRSLAVAPVEVRRVGTLGVYLCPRVERVGKEENGASGRRAREARFSRPERRIRLDLGKREGGLRFFLGDTVIHAEGRHLPYE